MFQNGKFYLRARDQSTYDRDEKHGRHTMKIYQAGPLFSDAYYKFMLTALNRSLKMMIDLLDVNTKEPTKDMLTISKFAKLCNVPVSSIRYWMSEGKIKPSTFTQSGYALFEPAQASDVKKLVK